MSSNLFSREKLRTLAFENTLTPLEIAALVKRPKYRELPFIVAKLLRTEPPKRFARHPITPEMTFFSAHRGARDLLIGFCGKSRRLMMPISHFLQLLDDQSYDVLVVTDPKCRHFEAGLPGHSSSLVETLKAVAAFAGRGEYRRLITYGTSMGGLPAFVPDYGSEQSAPSASGAVSARIPSDWGRASSKFLPST